MSNHSSELRDGSILVDCLLFPSLQVPKRKCRGLGHEVCERARQLEDKLVGFRAGQIPNESSRQKHELTVSPGIPNNARFVVVDFEQGTNEWLEWRHDGIGASDASAIMGENRFRSSAALMKEKREPVKKSFQNEAMALGTALEPEARKRYISKTGIKVKPVCVQSTQYDWLRASLDGITEVYDAGVEIKCGRSAYWSAVKSRSIPEYYRGQVQHIMAVTGLDALDYWCYWPDKPEILLTVERDDDYIDRLLNKEQQFWDQVQSG